MNADMRELIKSTFRIPHVTTNEARSEWGREPEIGGRRSEGSGQEYVEKISTNTNTVSLNNPRSPLNGLREMRKQHFLNEPQNLRFRLV